MTLDSVLNVVVPVIIFLLLFGLIYKKAKKPIDSFFAMVKGWFQGKEDGGGESWGKESSNYKIDYITPEY